MGQTIAAGNTALNQNAELLANHTANNANLSATKGETKSKSDDYAVPTAATAPVKSGDSPAKLKWRALYGAAQEAGLPPKERQDFANAYFDKGIQWTESDPSPDDHTKEIKKSDLKAGNTVRYKLSDSEFQNLKLRQTNYRLAGGKLGSNQNLPSSKELAQVKNGFDQSALRRDELNRALPNANGTTSTNGVNGSGTVSNTVDAAKQQPLKPLAQYQAEALKLIVNPNADPTDTGAARQRNQTITGAYADLYSKNPEAFVWLGAAAYASGQVGYAIDQASAMPDMSDTIDPTGDFTATAGLANLTTKSIKEMLAKGNITIFTNIYPASLAYQQGGIDELRRIENSLDDKAKERFTPVRAAYEQIDEGVQMNKQQPGSGNQKIKEGTEAIIDFEQRIVLQPIFDEYPVTVAAITPLTFGDLDADDTKTDMKTFGRFYMPQIVTTEDKENATVVVTNLGTSFGNPDARVKWIKEDVFPLWDTKRTERFEETQREMKTIIERGRAAGGRY